MYLTSMFTFCSYLKDYKPNWLFLTAFICCLFFNHFAFSQSSDDKIKQIENESGLKSARERLDELRKVFDETKQKEKGISSGITSLNKERKELNYLLLQTASRVKKSEAALTKIERKLGQLSVKEKSIRTEISKRHGTIAKMLAVMQRMGRQPPPIMATHRDDALKMVRSAMLLASVFPKLKSEADKMAGDLTNLVRIVTWTKTKAKELRVETQNLESQRKRLKNLIRSKKTKIIAQQNELKLVKKAANEYSRNARNLGDLITKLDREVSKKMGLGKYDKELARGNIGIKSRIDPKTGRKIKLIPEKKTKRLASLVSPARIKPAISFVRAKGLLPLPASGVRLKDFGSSNEYGNSSKGVLLGTRNEAQVTSPCDGWVVYAGPFRSYGQLLIINAGGGHHILLAGMGKIDVTTGQFVLAGEPVATMSSKKVQVAQSDKGYDQTLYIEFRKNGRPINPDPWWSDGQRKAQG